MLQRIHHINFVVNDLDTAVAQYEQLFGLNFSPYETLTPRGVKTARTRLGQVWLVLVEPTDPNGVPGRHLAEHGEGFFLISYKVDDVTDAAARLQKNGATLLNGKPRQGLDDWQLIDVDPAATFGVLTQIVESAGD